MADQSWKIATPVITSLVAFGVGSTGGEKAPSVASVEEEAGREGQQEKTSILDRLRAVPQQIKKIRLPRERKASEHKRCRGQVIYSPQAGAACADAVLDHILRMFLEKLTRGGRFDGFIDPAGDDVGMLWVEVVCDDRGSPLKTSFYIRKGSSRKVTESKRRRMEEVIREMEGISSISVENISNQMGDDPLPLLPDMQGAVREQRKTVYISYLDVQQQVVLRAYPQQPQHTTWYELGTRRKKTKRHQHLFVSTSSHPGDSCTDALSRSQQNSCGACGYFKPPGVRQCARCLSQLRLHHISPALAPHHGSSQDCHHEAPFADGSVAGVGDAACGSSEVEGEMDLWCSERDARLEDAGLSLHEHAEDVMLDHLDILTMPIETGSCVNGGSGDSSIDRCGKTHDEPCDDGQDDAHAMLERLLETDVPLSRPAAKRPQAADSCHLIGPGGALVKEVGLSEGELKYEGVLLKHDGVRLKYDGLRFVLTAAKAFSHVRSLVIQKRVCASACSRCPFGYSAEECPLRKLQTKVARKWRRCSLSQVAGPVPSQKAG